VLADSADNNGVYALALRDMGISALEMRQLFDGVGNYVRQDHKFQAGAPGGPPRFCASSFLVVPKKSRSKRDGGAAAPKAERTEKHKLLEKVCWWHWQ
jgi:hypothetical protein